MAIQFTFTKSAKDVYAPTDPSGTPRGASMVDAQQFGIEIEAAFKLLGETINSEVVYFATKAAMDADLAHDADTIAKVYDDGANNGTYKKSGASGSGSWTLLFLEVLNVDYSITTDGTSNYSLGEGSFGEWAAVTPTGANNVSLGIQASGALTSGGSNTNVGHVAGRGNTTGSGNTVMGAIAGYRFVGGSYNVIIGNLAMNVATGAVSNNVAVGYRAANSYNGNEIVAIGSNALGNATGVGSTAIGTSAGFSTTTGARQTLLGYNAQGGAAFSDVIVVGYNAAATASEQIVFGTSTQKNLSMFGIGFARWHNANSNLWIGDDGPTANPTGATNMGLGRKAANSVTSGTNNLGIGSSALELQTTGSNNIALGTVAAQYGISLADCVYMGVKAGRYQTTGTGATAVGFRALEHNAEARNNTAIGDSALWHTQGTGNTAVGYVTAEGLSQGNENVMVGRGAGRYRDDGDFNIFIGNLSGGILSNASSNIGFSDAAPGDDIGGVAAGDRNVGLGHHSLLEFLGSDVVAIGFDAGKSLVGSAAVSLNSVFVGANSGDNASQKTDAANSIAIGANTFTDKDNQVVLGDASIAETNIRGVTRHTTFTVATLPSAATMGAGARAFVTDATAETFASVVAGGGANKVPVYSDGTNWKIG